MDTTGNNTRVVEYDIIRVVACCLVVLGHASLAETVQRTPQNMQTVDFFYYVYRVIYSFHMPLFFMLAGACASLSPVGISLNMLKKRSVRLLLPYFTLGLLLVVPTYFLSRADSPCLLRLYGQFLIFDYGHNYHIWFLAALFIVSMLSAGIHRIFEGIIQPKAVVLFLSTILFVVGHYNPGNSEFIPYITLWKDWFWYACGLYFLPCVIQWRIKNKWVLLSFLIAGFVSFFGVFIFRDFYRKLDIVMFGDYFFFYSILVLLGTFACVMLAKVLATTQLHTRAWFRMAVGVSMTVYLYHVVFYWIFCKIARDYEWMESTIGIVCYYVCQTIGVVFLSLLVCCAIRPVKGLWKTALGG